MKKSTLTQLFYGLIISLSVCSFVFLNVQSAPAVSGNANVNLEQMEDQEPSAFALPDVELIKNILGTVLHLLPDA